MSATLPDLEYLANQVTDELQRLNGHVWGPDRQQQLVDDLAVAFDRILDAHPSVSFYALDPDSP